MSLLMRAKLAEQIHSHLCSTYPEEGCGVMLGRDASEGREVVRILALENAREDSRGNRYVIAPEDVLAAEREARAAGLDVVGFYHSHPDHPARPSAFDLEHAWPYYSYVIVSVERGRAADVQGWRLAEDRSAFVRETIEILPESVTGRTGDRP